MIALHLTLTATADEVVGMSQAISHRALGRVRVFMVFLMVLIGGTAVGQAIAWIVGMASIDAALVSVYTIVGATLAFFLSSYLSRKAFRRMLHASAFRQSVCPIIFSDDGLVYERRPLPWSAITGIGRWKNCTLLHFSAADALIVPDRDLPPSETPESFAARIETWRSGSGADR